jgi:aryl-alcohol dehydrogenase-like predicted oxidoreductase
MKYRRLGHSGLEVSVIGLGTNTFGDDIISGGRMDYGQSETVLKQALEEGINLIDTANTYGRRDVRDHNRVGEEFLGRMLKGTRDKVVLSTKVGNNRGDGPNQYGCSRKHIMEQIEKSLRRLQTDYLDLYQLHYYDPFTPMEETMLTLDHLVTQGKVRYIGCSNFAAWQVAEAIGTARFLGTVPFVSVEPEYNMLKRGIEKELLPCCRKFKLGIIPYFPLASGFLTGKYKRGKEVPRDTRLGAMPHRAETLLTGQNFDVLEKLEAFASKRGHTLIELAFAWLLGHPEVSSIIAGATSPEQVRVNSRANEWELSSAEMEELDGILRVLASTWDKPTQHLGSPSWATT